MLTTDIKPELSLTFNFLSEIIDSTTPKSFDLKNLTLSPILNLFLIKNILGVKKIDCYCIQQLEKEF